MAVGFLFCLAANGTNQHNEDNDAQESIREVPSVPAGGIA